jgi:hypothetical protein
MRHAKALLTVQSVLWVGLATSLSVSAVNIFEAGARERASDATAIAYTPEAVGAAALQALPIFALAVVATVACVVLRVRGGEAKGPEDLDAAHARAVARVATPTEEMVAESRRRKTIHIAGGTLSLACAVRSGMLVYLSAIGTEGMADRLVGPAIACAYAWLIVGVAMLAVTMRLSDRSKRAEMDAARVAIETWGRASAPTGVPKVTYGVKAAPQPVRLALLVVAVLAISWGIVAGGVDAVGHRANVVCTECVGLG